MTRDTTPHTCTTIIDEEEVEQEEHEDCTDAASNEQDSIYNLTTGHGDSNLWTALLSSSLGYLLPNPTLRRNGD